MFLLGCSPVKPSNAGAEGAGEQTAAGTAETEAPEVSLQAGDTEPEEQTGPWFALIPAEARPGEPVTVGYSDDSGGAGPRKLQAVLLDSRGRRLAKAAFFSLAGQEPEFTAGELEAAILAIPSTAGSGNALIRIESADGMIRDLPFTINSREFFRETIPLNEENTDLRTKPDPEKTAESEQLWAILSRTGKEIFCGGQFMAPVTSTRRTSGYGDRRIYSYIDGTSDSTIHAGIDYGVPTGTEVRACAAGRVVFAGLRIVTGNSVILEHLPGVYSLYYHMDKIAVSKGSMVEAGTILGQSGSTGLATGPHLHWEIRVSTEFADPDVFLARPVLDKKDIINKLRAGD